MTKGSRWILTLAFLGLLNAESVEAQSVADSAWTLTKCIDFALEQNVSVRRAKLDQETNEVYYKQAKAARFPSVVASAGQNFAWSRSLDANNEYGSYSGTNSTSLSLDANLVLFNGFRNTNTIRQKDLTRELSELDLETQKETISLNVMDAYLQVLYAEEQIRNLEEQVKTTEQQVVLAEERFRLGAIASSDLLQVKSELASEKQSLASAQSTLAMAKVNLMQVMELPVSEDFKIAHPSFSEQVNEHRLANAASVYSTAEGIKPQIKRAQLNEEIAVLDVALAKGNLYPTLSLNAGLSSGYTSALSGLGYGYQVGNRLTPTVGLTLSIPIYQRRQVKSSIEIAQIGTSSAELTTLETKNSLRKAVEQACVDVNTAEKEYEASQEGYSAALASYQVAEEKYRQGAINSVDYLIQKNTLISAESTLLQSKYNLIFAYKTLDFYLGKSLSF